MLPHGTFYSGGGGLVRVGIAGAPACWTPVVCRRLTGDRALSEMNRFDIVVTVALGSMLAAIILSGGATLAEGVPGFALPLSVLCGVTWTSVRFKGFRRWVKSAPCVLIHDGTSLDAAMQRERATHEEEALAALREAVHDDLGQLRSVILGTHSRLSAVAAAPAKPCR